MVTAKIHAADITETDYNLIRDVVNYYGVNTSFVELSKVLNHIFLTNIKPGHYMILGYLIGERVATVQATRNFSNSLKLCQRQN